MKIGRYLPCASCRRQWVPVAPDAPHTAVLCPTCQPQPTRLQLAFSHVYNAIRARLRPSVVMVWVAVYLAAIAGMGAAMLLR